jgi:predicted dehydrogenase
VRPFKRDIYHPFHWRGWQDFGGGAIGDFGCHILDTPFKALGLTAPHSLRAEVPSEWAENSSWNRENWPDWEVIYYQFPGTPLTANSSIDVTWYDGGKQPELSLFGFDSAERRPPASGALFIGEQGRLLLPHVGRPELLLDGRSAPEWPAVDGFSHYHAFVDACLGKGQTGSSFSYAGPLAEATLLGTIAVRFPDQTLAWDAAQMRFTNHSEANRFVGREPRDGWKYAELILPSG